MHFDFPAILVLLTFATGLIWLLDILFLRRKRENDLSEEGSKEPMLMIGMMISRVTVMMKG